MFAGIKLALMLFGKSVARFIKSNWKWLLPLLAIIGLLIYHNIAVENAVNEGFIAGVRDEKDKQQALVNEQNKKNREFEALITTAIADFGKSIIQDTAKRTATEIKLRDNVTTIIRDNPIYQQCVVDLEVLEARNTIRELGPSIRMEIQR